MGNGVGPRFHEAWIAFRTNALRVIEGRGMNKNDIAKPIQERGGPVSKTTYNALGPDHVPNIETMQAIAEELDLPLWLLCIPGLPEELVKNERERKQLERIVTQYVKCRDTGRQRIAETAQNWHDIDNPKQS
jgi:hypothetical protein